MFQDLSLRSIETGFGGFKTRLKFIKFRLGTGKFVAKTQFLLPLPVVG